VSNNARTVAYNSLGFNGSTVINDDSSAGVATGGTWGTTNDWGAFGLTLDTADTPDIIFRQRNHTTDSAWATTNAATAGSPGYDAALPAADGRLQFGRWLTSDYLNGQIAIVAIWNRKLSSTEWDEIIASDRTSDLWNVSGGAPVFLCEFNVAAASLVDLASHAVVDTPVSAPSLSGPNPDRWTFDGTGFVPPATGPGQYGWGNYGDGNYGSNFGGVSSTPIAGTESAALTEGASVISISATRTDSVAVTEPAAALERQSTRTDTFSLVAEVTPALANVIAALDSLTHSDSSQRLSSLYAKTVATTSGLMGYWRLGETSGTTAYDVLGARNGTYGAAAIQGDPGAIVNDIDTSLEVDGTANSDVVVSSAPAPTSAITLEAWVYKPSSFTGSNSRIIDRPFTSFADPFSDWDLVVDPFDQPVNYWQMEITIGGVFRSLPTLSAVAANQWHHMVGTYDGSELRLYIDGVLANSMNVSGAIANSGTPLYFGRYGADSTAARFTGGIDEVAVYSRALTPTEVQTHYMLGIGGVELAASDSAAVTDAGAVAAAITSLETHTQTDLSSLTMQVLVAVSDALTQGDASSLTITDLKIGSDSGTFSGAGAVSAAVAALESHALTEAYSLSSLISVLDSLIFTDTATLLQTTAKSGSDTWSMADVSALTATVQVAATDAFTDTDSAQVLEISLKLATDAFAYAAETATIQVELSAADALLLSEAVTIAIAAAITDALTMSEQVDLVRASSLSDALTQSEASAIATAIQANADSATQTEGTTTLTNLVSRTDDLTVSEIAAYSAALVALETHTLTDVVSSSGQQLLVTANDSLTFTDFSSLLTQNVINVVDAAVQSDASVLAVAASAADNLTLGEIAAINATLARVDDLTLIEDLIASAAFTRSDLSTLTDVGIPSATLDRIDTSTLSDSSALVADAIASEASVLGEALSILADVLASGDSALTSEAIEVILHKTAVDSWVMDAAAFLAEYAGQAPIPTLPTSVVVKFYATVAAIRARQTSVSVINAPQTSVSVTPRQASVGVVPRETNAEVTSRLTTTTVI
jgi:hypothetical protein